MRTHQSENLLDALLCYLEVSTPRILLALLCRRYGCPGSGCRGLVLSDGDKGRNGGNVVVGQVL